MSPHSLVHPLRCHAISQTLKLCGGKALIMSLFGVHLLRKYQGHRKTTIADTGYLQCTASRPLLAMHATCVILTVATITDHLEQGAEGWMAVVVRTVVVCDGETLLSCLFILYTHSEGNQTFCSSCVRCCHVSHVSHGNNGWF